MKRILFFLLLISTFAKAQQVGTDFRTPRVFNVVQYGAKHDGVTDDTPPIQAAINACAAAGGGTVWFPKGVYIIAGAIQTSVGAIDMNSQIYIPWDTARSGILTINIVGESSASPGNASISSPFDPGGYADQGVTLYSTYTGTRSTTAKGTAIIGSGSLSSTTFNANTVTIKNINFKAKNNPNGFGPEIGGFNAKYLIGCGIDYCTYYLDTPASKMVIPSRDISGFETEENSGGASYSVTNTSVTGTKWGYIFGEHVSGYQNSASVCYYGFGMKPGHHASSLLRANAYWCTSGIAYYPYSGPNASPQATFDIYGYDVEYGEGNTGKFYNTIYTVNDSLNKMIANINYAVVEQGVGFNNSKWLMNGATGVKAFAIGTISSTTPGGSTTQMQFNDGGAFNGTSLMTVDKVNGSITLQSAATTSFTPFLINNSVGNAGIALTSAATTSQTFVQFINDRSSLASYGDIIYGGSTNAGGNLFGVNRRDKLMIFADGSSNLGMYLGTLQAQPLVFGTNNTAVMSIASGGNVTVTGGSGNDMFDITGSGSGGNALHLIGSNSAGQIGQFWENNRGSLVSYGGVIYGGSANSIGNLFGVSRADKMFLVADGANNLGMAVGTLQSQSLILGTNNTARLTIDPTGNSTFVGIAQPATTVTYDLGTASLAWRDVYFSHLVGESAIGTSTSLGTNVSSLTPAGNDNDFSLTLVTSGAVAGTMGQVSFGRAWGATPKCVISSANATTGSAVALSVGGYFALNATSGTSLTMAGLITASGTYTFNCHCSQ